MKSQFKILLCFVYTIAWFFTKAQNDINGSSITVGFRTISVAPTIIPNSIFNSNKLQFKRSLQSLNFDTTPSKDDYLLKSRHQKTIAWIMLGGGAGLTALGFAIASTNSITNSSNSDAGATIVAIAGLASMAGSIPLFISAAHNKKKAATLAFNLQHTPMIYANGNCAVTFQPAIKLKINL